MARKDTQQDNRTIVLPVTQDAYRQCMDDSQQARQMLDAAYPKHPGLCPAEMDRGDKFNGTTRPSKT